MANERRQSGQSAASGTKRRMRFYIAGIVIFSCWALYALINQEHRLNVESGRLSEAKSEKAATERQIANLKQEIERLHDPEYIGQLANKQGMVREGEKVIEVTE
ncbi:FtsB family cell division protein [Paenibacillus xylaniclasticus]|uniref:FtsB family cell division protein n=1 Tax=Paenibacillus xylaniclasticus TaxID=588083 RepID=UPI000FD7232A|nr:MULTISPECIES: septum formation initiator family protein [Paenibacillus]